MYGGGDLVYVCSSYAPPPLHFLIDAITLGAFLHKFHLVPYSRLPWLLLATISHFYLPSLRTPTVHLNWLCTYPWYAPNTHRPSRFNTSREALAGDRCVVSPVITGCSAYSSIYTPATDTTCRSAFVVCVSIPYRPSAINITQRH